MRLPIMPMWAHPRLPMLMSAHIIRLELTSLECLSLPLAGFADAPAYACVGSPAPAYAYVGSHYSS